MSSPSAESAAASDHDRKRDPTLSSSSISGSVPGILDKSQSARLLRHPSSTLSFASFDPHAATQTDVPDLRKLSIHHELYRSKRIVIESMKDGECFWRFVPRAKREAGCLDEGTWPRVVEICGEFVECSLEQWEIYKLDPAYDCLVRLPPNTTVISRVPNLPPRPTPPNPSPVPQAPPQKRRRSEPPCPTDPLEQDEEAAEEAMMIDEPFLPERPHKRARPAPLHPRPRTEGLREETAKERQARREKIVKAAQKSMGTGDGEGDGVKIPSTRVPPSSPGKRKAPAQPDTPSRPQPTPTANKRPRHVSPGTQQRLFTTKRMTREKQKQEETERRLGAWRATQAERLRDVCEDFAGYAEEVRDESGGAERGEAANGEMHHEENGAPCQGDPKGSSAAPGPTRSPPAETRAASSGQERARSNSADRPDGRKNVERDEEAERQAAIAESRAKLAELERDRPQWEQEAKKRRDMAAAEEQERKAKAEEHRRAAARNAEEEEQAKARRERQERKQRDSPRRERERAARRQGQSGQRHSRWSSGIWTTHQALERYQTLCESFDTIKFTPDDPLTLADVPWPVLHPPASFGVEDVDWSSVELFFEAVETIMREEDYTALVEKSHRRFHPDRWRSRGLLISVEDEGERGCLEVAANTVAQALTPLWMALRGR